ncbi:DNA repair protein RecN [Deltaproteobacteria bacterium Smac51]|nr:DNA repair protein RecN [Deltaproteobacteria bacterium Smac51]
MLSELNVKNLALIDALSISFGPGANIMTGETGAGKSILVGALGLLMGRRASADLVRAGADEARITALFNLESPALFSSLLEPMGVDISEEIVLSRVISAAGKTRAHVNGTPVTQSQLGALGEALLSISGQHDQQTLLKPASQLEYLDRFGQHPQLLADMRAAWQALAKTVEALRKLEEGLKDTEEKRDLYEFQLSEINKVKPKANEDDELLEEKARAKNSLKLSECLDSAMTHLGNEPGNVVEKLGLVKRSLERAAEIDARLAEAFATAEDCYHQLADLMVEMSRLSRDEGEDPDRIDWVDDRLNSLAKLKRKYGPALSDVIERGQRLTETLEQLDGAGLDLARLRRERDAALTTALNAADKLSKARRKAGGKLAAKLTESLRPLGFPKIEMKVEVASPSDESPDDDQAEIKRLTGRGFDQVNFLFSPNPGEGMKPLAKIASGGELSRVMLALKTVQDRPSDQLLVFDEIDTGLGGATAEAVAAKIAALAGRQQVIVITHLPQMAALAGQHFVVAKEADDKAGRTTTTITPLSENARVTELSRMLGGAAPSREAVALAEQLLSGRAI